MSQGLKSNDPSSASPVERLQLSLSRIPTAAYLFILILIELVKVGIWWKPVVFKLALAQNPLTNPWPDSPLTQSHMWTWLSPAIAHVLGATSPETYLLLHLTFVVAFFTTIAIAVHVRLQRDRARLALLLLACLPITPTLLIWIGDDGLTALLLALIVITSQKWFLSFLFAALLGMQHFEVGILAVAVLAIAHVVGKLTGESRPFTISFLLRMLLGIIAGHLFLRSIFRASGVKVTGGRSAWLEEYSAELLQQFFTSWQFILYSLLAAAWLIYFNSFRFRSVTAPLSVGAALLVTFAVTALVFDQTRIAALVLLPTMLAYWILRPAFLYTISLHANLALFGVWLVTPVIWVWLGEIQTGSISAISELLLQGRSVLHLDFTDSEIFMLPFRE